MPFNKTHRVCYTGQTGSREGLLSESWQVIGILLTKVCNNGRLGLALILCP
jgi:hypothetical protein